GHVRLRVAAVDRQDHFSTPVITIPRVKKRWKTRNAMTGMISVSSVPAWIRPGFSATRAPWKLASPTGSVTRSGVVDREMSGAEKWFHEHTQEKDETGGRAA